MTEMRISLPEDLLEIVSMIIQDNGMDFFIVGAIARDINLSTGNGVQSPRTTEDLDIAIRVPSVAGFQAVINQLVKTGEFEMISGNPIRLIYKKAIELDFLPFGELESENREVYLPNAGKPYVISVPGLEEVREICKEIELISGVRVQYCPLEGIVLLKLISWYHNPGRIKDREDIAHICKVYFEYVGDEIYEHAYDLLHIYDSNDYEYRNLVASHYLGRKVRQIIKENTMLLKIMNDKLKKLDGHFSALLDGINDKT